MQVHGSAVDLSNRLLLSSHKHVSWQQHRIRLQYENNVTTQLHMHRQLVYKAKLKYVNTEGLTSGQNVNHMVEPQGCELKRPLIAGAQHIKWYPACPDRFAGPVTNIPSQYLHVHLCLLKCERCMCWFVGVRSHSSHTFDLLCRLHIAAFVSMYHCKHSAGTGVDAELLSCLLVEVLTVNMQPVMTCGWLQCSCA